MKTRNRIVRAAILTAFTMFLILPEAAFGQVSDTIHCNKIVTNAQMIGLGGVQILDTYLSPEVYTGTEFLYNSHTVREKDGSCLVHTLQHQGSFSYSNNRADNSNYVAGAYSFTYGLHYKWAFLGGRMNVRAGAQAEVYAGFLYNTRNGNNPAQARLSLNVSPSAAVSYRFRIWNVPFCAQYEASAPLVGVMFSPNYGQSYYEIFTQGNYDHNIVPTTFGSTPCLRNMLTLDFTLKRTTLRIGWLGDFRQAKVNNLKYHEYSNMLVLGLVRHFKITKIVP